MFSDEALSRTCDKGLSGAKADVEFCRILCCFARHLSITRWTRVRNTCAASFVCNFQKRKGQKFPLHPHSWTKRSAINFYESVNLSLSCLMRTLESESSPHWMRQRAHANSPEKLWTTLLFKSVRVIVVNYCTENIYIIYALVYDYIISWSLCDTCESRINTYR